MRIKYKHYGVRIWGGLVWDKSNDFTLDIQDAALAANLLTYPHDEFAVAPDEPLLICGLYASHVIGLAMCGIASLDRARAMSEPEVAQVAQTWQVPAKVVQDWLDTLAAQPIAEPQQVAEQPVAVQQVAEPPARKRIIRKKKIENAEEA